MAFLQFEGDLGSLSDRQQKFIRDVLEKRGYTTNTVVFEKAGKVGDNYVANVLRISVKVEDSDDFKMIAKVAPCTEMLRLSMNTAQMFRNETTMYEQVLPKLVKLQIKADVPEEERFKYAKCYGTLSEEPNEVVLLEDLNVADYIMLDRFTALGDNEIKMIIKNFAILHSLSYVLKKSEPGVYEILRSKLFDIWDASNEAEQYHTFLAHVENVALEALDDENYKNIVRGLVTGSTSISAKLRKQDNKSKYAVITQGDAWTNNILFKLEGEKPIDCIMIDYQISRESLPVSDILYMVLNCTDHATRSKHYYEWIDYYHEQLDRSLSNFGLKANYVYPRDQLDVDLKRYSKVFFATSVLLANFMSRKSEESIVMEDAIDANGDLQENMGMGNLSSDTIVVFRNKIKDLVDSWREFGYI